MKAIMKTTLLACLLLAALQFSQAGPAGPDGPAAALAETEATNSLAAPERMFCVLRMILTFFRDLPYLAYICVEQSKLDTSFPFFITFPICAAIAGGADVLRVVADVSMKCWA
ncbi:putative salivary gland protein 19 [Frankliniella occidentalis]|uniref:Uncharacterized protein LOC113206162 n=1 Tax=Frankliniella occidentalis TaxID=133901 RepID=A0A6J1S9M9_FRAOC|nr:uncharacterized protein LOC113206162 [Frankliniella occidentalis]KAE8740323.1 putative salivary gland protein 19 [Frankliniella occidentalis]